MSIKENFKKAAANNKYLAPIYFRLTLPYFTWLFNTQLKKGILYDFNSVQGSIWKQRIADVVNCPDNKFIQRVEDAGKLTGKKLIMHNGISIHPLSYYGKYNMKMLIDNKGVHEPQEERIFNKVLKCIPKNSTMLELGSYWSFYSMWFNKTIVGAKNYMVEPNFISLENGKLNFRINKMKGKFINAYVGAKFQKGNVPTVSVDFIVEKNKIEHLHILHSDIQGFEYDMLKGAENTFNTNKISYVFVSTHSNELHQQCTDFLVKKGFTIIASANCDQTFSVDGTLVGRAAFVNVPDKINIALK